MASVSLCTGPDTPLAHRQQPGELVLGRGRVPCQGSNSSEIGPRGQGIRVFWAGYSLAYGQ